MLEEEAPSSDSRNKVFFYENWSSWKLLEDQRSPAHIQGALALFVHLRGAL
jgi:quinol monooxygenase YgiN